MAHEEQQNYFQFLHRRFSDIFALKCANILEIGSQNINGTVRGFFAENANYIGIDLGKADGVDWVIPGELIELPDGWGDVSISTECFEHAEAWDRIFLNMIRITKPGGLIVLTMAGDGRATHGTLDSDVHSSPFTPLYYKNLGPTEIAEKVRLGFYFSSHGFEINSQSNDTNFWGIRSAVDLSRDDEWQEPLDRLARAQGQLSQAVARHNELKADAELARADAVKAREEAEQLKENLERREIDVNGKLEELKQIVHARDNSTIWKSTAPLRSILDRLRGH